MKLKKMSGYRDDGRVDEVWNKRNGMDEAR